MSAPVPDHASLPVEVIRAKLDYDRTYRGARGVLGCREQGHFPSAYRPICLSCGVELAGDGWRVERDFRWFMGRDTP